MSISDSDESGCQLHVNLKMGMRIDRPSLLRINIETNVKWKQNHDAVFSFVKKKTRIKFYSLSKCNKQWFSLSSSVLEHSKAL